MAPMEAPRGTLLIACGALGREIAALRRANGWKTLAVRCLPAQLHNRPERIAPAVRAEIRANRARYSQIFVVYADCGTRGSPSTASRARKLSQSIGPFATPCSAASQAGARRAGVLPLKARLHRPSAARLTIAA